MILIGQIHCGMVLLLRHPLGVSVSSAATDHKEAHEGNKSLDWDLPWVGQHIAGGLDGG